MEEWFIFILQPTDHARRSFKVIKPNLFYDPRPLCCLARFGTITY
jgi:hypothetical protein